MDFRDRVRSGRSRRCRRFRRADVVRSVCAFAWDLPLVGGLVGRSLTACERWDGAPRPWGVWIGFRLHSVAFRRWGVCCVESDVLTWFPCYAGIARRSSRDQLLPSAPLLGIVIVVDWYGSRWFWRVLMVLGRSWLGSRSRLVGAFVFMYWPVVAGLVASIALIGSMLLASEFPPVEVPLSWSDALRSGLARPAGAGCFAPRW